jgi:hypothetical protein
MKWLIANRWVFVPILLLSLTVAIAVATVLSAVVGHPLGMEPGYDRKAAAWDEERAQRAANDRLRWVVTGEVDSRGAERSLRIVVEDKHAARIDAESVVVECIPIRAAEARQTVELARAAEGDFQGTFRSALGGQWEFRVEVRRGGERYTDGFRRPLAHARGVEGAKGAAGG